MTTTEILTGIKNWVLSKLNLKQDVINDLAAIRSGSHAGSTAVQPSDLSSYFNNASYDTNTHRINFYHGQNIVAYVDASPFIVDGMVNDVRIENGYFVIDFNTDSGKQDISIPLTDIFDPSNYYNKTQTDVLLAQKQDVIQDLANIRSGAQDGSTAVQPSTLNSVIKNTVAESGVYDVSANNDNAKFESLSALLSSANLNTLIPTDIRKGGMSIKFVHSSDNKYVQYRYMLDDAATNSKFANVSNWHGFNYDNEVVTYSLGDSSAFYSYVPSTYLKRYYHVYTKEVRKGYRVTLGEIPSGYSYYIAFYDTYEHALDAVNKASIEGATWNTFDYTVINDNSHYLLVGVRKNNDTVITTSDKSIIDTALANIYEGCIILRDGVGGEMFPSSTAKAIKYKNGSLKDYLDEKAIEDQRTLSYGFKNELSFSGQGNTGVFKFFYLIPNRKYRIKLSNTNWSTTDVTSAIFSIQHVVNGTYTADIAVLKGSTPNSYYDITAVEADLYLIGFRGDLGSSLKVEIVPIVDANDVISDSVSAAYSIDAVCSYFKTSISELPYANLSNRLRFSVYFPSRPWKVHVNAENVPAGYSFSLQSNYTLQDAQDRTVNGVEAGAWDENDVLFTNPAAIWLTIGFKKSSGLFTDSDIDTIINSGITLSVSNENKKDLNLDIVSLNDEHQTLRYLRNLKRPNISDDGAYTWGKIPFTLLHFSDLHADAVNLGRIIEYRKHYMDYIDDTICSGDIIRNKFSDSYDFWAAANAQSILVSTGNHEYYNGESSDYYTQITPKQVYDKFFAPYLANWGDVVFPENAATEGYNYYYKDYADKKIRLIVLDNMANMSATRNNVQSTWLANVLESARQSQYHVICVIHIGSTIITKFDNPFTSLSAFINTDNGANAQTYEEFYTLRDAVETFINNGGKFVAWITGHTHRDTIGMLTNYNQCIIHVPTAAGGDTQRNVDGHVWWIIPQGDDCSRADGTKSQDCFNLYSVDTEKGMLRLFRVGNDLDRYGRHKGTLVYDYINRTVIYND